jgi:hypothetical protein
MFYSFVEMLAGIARSNEKSDGMNVYFS